MPAFCSLLLPSYFSKNYAGKIAASLLKAPPVLVCTENTALGGVSRDKYSTRLRLVLYLSLDTPPRAVFSVQTRGGALSNIYWYIVTKPLMGYCANVQVIVI